MDYYVWSLGHEEYHFVMVKHDTRTRADRVSDRWMKVMVDDLVRNGRRNKKLETSLLDHPIKYSTYRAYHYIMVVWNTGDMAR